MLITSTPEALGALLKGLDEGMSQVALQILRDAAQKAYGEARRAHDRAKHMYEQEMHDARETACKRDSMQERQHDDFPRDAE